MAYIPHVLDIDITELAPVPTNVIQQIVRICPLRRPVQINEIVQRWRFWDLIHTVLGVLHLPDPPDSVHHPVVKPEYGIARGGVEILFHNSVTGKYVTLMTSQSENRR
jgi:hypothetical protein